MAEIVRRMNFASLYDTDIWQSYFADMSRQGLHLHSIGVFTIRFQRGEPGEYRYCTAFLPQAPDLECQQFYRQCGWEYVCWQRTFCVLRAAGAAENLEYPFDRAGQILYLSKMEKRQRNYGAVALVFSLISVVLQLMLFFNDRALRYFYLSFNPFLFLISLCLPVVIPCAWHTVRRCRLGLIEGASAKENTDWRKARRRNGMAIVLLLLIAIVSLVPSYVILSHGSFESYYLPDHPSTIAVSLESIEGRDDLQRFYHWVEDRDIGNTRGISFSFLVPQQISYRTSLTTSPVNDSYDADHYYPYLSVDHYTMLLPFTATHLAQELCAERSWWPRLSVAVLDDSRFDALYVMNDDHPNGSVLREYPIAAALGGHVLVANYIGEAEMSRVIDEMARVLAELQ